jgi:hypothetical protein
MSILRYAGILTRRVTSRFSRRALAAFLAIALVAILLPNLPPTREVRANPGPINAGNTTVNSSSANRASATFSHTVPTGTDRLLLVIIHMEGTRVVNSVTFNGVALTRILQADSANNARGQIQIWYLVAPPEIAANVVVTYSANQDWDGITVLNYTGVHQTAPFGNVASVTAATASTAATISRVAKNYDSIFVGAITAPGGAASPMTPGSGINERSDFATGTGGAGTDGSCWTADRAAGTPNTSYTMNATLSASVRWTMATLEIVPPSTTSLVVYQSQTINTSSANRSVATFSHTTPSGNQRLLVVVIHMEGTRVVNSVTYNGLALTLQKTQDSGSNTNTQTRFYTLISPPVGAYNVVVTYSANQDWDAVVAMSYSGVDQATPVGGTAGASSPSTTITSTVAGSVLLGAATGAGGTTYPMRQGGGQDERYDTQTGIGAAGTDGGLSASDMPAPVTATYGYNVTYNTGVTGTVAVIELRPSPPEISNNLASYNFSTVSEGSATLSGLTRFRVTNLSGFAINITVSGTDMTGGNTWTLSDNASTGTDIYGLVAGLNEFSIYNVTVKKNSPYNVLITGLASGAYKDWGLKLLAPSTFSDEVTKTGTVTLTAVAA